MNIAPAAARIIGGPHVTVSGAEFLNASDFQVACIGEGVETLSEISMHLCQTANVDFAAIDGIVFKDAHGQVHANALREPLLELDAYPFPSDSLPLFWEGADPS